MVLPRVKEFQWLWRPGTTWVHRSADSVVKQVQSLFPESTGKTKEIFRGQLCQAGIPQKFLVVSAQGRCY